MGRRESEHIKRDENDMIKCDTIMEHLNKQSENNILGTIFNKKFVIFPKQI